ncbi:sulfatase-like hydrolase/transferase [Paenibacillus apiarius]|uniref:Sulfatase-like hydrolase/transferase n=1 Tax=Paenibacillus apiarius TaxID=46240 RepID=A0ABT4E1H6_9BACL|nr:sulfatase-like hydrolase/transferase [Paenibacillus apiarius]MCY9512606.1 sulfatase-like hydrolase/transferase [Paenibacillus apiarius]MCY9522363.1 sulfatase-like hydrolase/transferase [Paenibacillus apiarius]MCY9553673.1 sulfatase-like hydrolase/transferase [Paenibacillus apiarius]MCY9556616.1 sulfatase-like hydrolase/transferase [Paenibacillus apiarius]MCY9682847.1 sulfatase-like hydrolase/transferase [Paenibacillus apiarius]
MLKDSARKPNIVFMVADDHRYESIRAHGNKEVETPTLDKLSKRGVSFQSTNIIGGMDGAVCAPCRACLNTGSSIFGATVKQDLGDTMEKLTIAPRKVTMAEAFRQNGYYSYAVGKWHNDKASFNRSFCGGNQIFFGGMSDHRQVPVYSYDPTGAYAADMRKIETTFSTELFANEAASFIRSYEREEPFFLYVAFTSPHDPRTAPEPYASQYDANALQLPANYAAEHPFDNGEMHVRDEGLAALPRDPGEVRQHIADYYAMITHQDAQMGRIVQSLDDSGRLQDTIIVYTSDHGLAVGQHGLMGKQNLYEHSIRIPWLMAGPGVPERESVGGQVFQMDIMPTLCDVAGIDIPASVEGRSMKPLMNGNEGEGRETVYSLYKDTQRMVKDGHWKLIRYRRSAWSHEGTDTLQLFDLTNDPAETRNLAHEPGMEQHLERLQQEMEQWMRRVGDPFVEHFCAT